MHSPPTVTGPAHPAGWYPDPWGRAVQRWWDGGQWTEHEAGVATPPPQHVPVQPTQQAQPDVPRFGARGKARELAGEVEEPRAQVERLSRLDILSVEELQQRHESLREFFYATPQEVKQHLVDLAGELLEYEEFPEAVEYRQTLNQSNGAA